LSRTGAEPWAIRVEEAASLHLEGICGDTCDRQGEAQVDTRNNRDFGRVMIRSVFNEVSVGI
jgi:hypothetical protein